MRAHTLHVRQEAITLWQSGQKKSIIARQLGVDYDTLLGWIKRYGQEGENGLGLRYNRSGRAPKESSVMVRGRCLQLAAEHTGWGAAYLRLHLEREFAGQVLVKARQIQRWIAQAGIRAKQTKLPVVEGDWAQRPLQRVQADAKERLQTADGKECCYLNFIDEHSGAALDAFVFPLCTDQSSAGELGV